MKSLESPLYTRLYKTSEPEAIAGENMRHVFIIKNQNNEYLDKSGEWVSTDAKKTFYNTAFKDEAINQKVEYTVKQPELRLSIEKVEINEKNNLILAEQESLATQVIGEEVHTTLDASNSADVEQNIEEEQTREAIA